MNMKMQVYDTRDSGNALYVNTSNPAARNTSTFSRSQSERSSGEIAMAIHQMVYTMASVHR